MRYWYAYAAKTLLLGHGRTLRGVAGDAPVSLLNAARAYYTRYAAPRRKGSAADATTYEAALLASFAARSPSYC